MMLDLVASEAAQLTLFDDAGNVRSVVLCGITTVIVGDGWLTLQVGDRKWVRSPDLTYRIATEPDVQAKPGGKR